VIGYNNTMKTLIAILLYLVLFAVMAQSGMITFTGRILASNGPSITTQSVVTSSNIPLVSYALSRVQGSSVLIKTITYQ
jgi:hypothetical protein